MGHDIDTVNPYDPPERQALEQKLQDDTHLLHETHDMEQRERQLADDAGAAGYGHDHTDARIQDLEHSEQTMGGIVVKDQQNIDHWDHDHPGWQNHLDDYQPADAPAGAPGDYPSPDADTSYAYADGGDGTEAG